MLIYIASTLSMIPIAHGVTIPLMTETTDFFIVHVLLICGSSWPVRSIIWHVDVVIGPGSSFLNMVAPFWPGFSGLLDGHALNTERDFSLISIGWWSMLGIGLSNGHGILGIWDIWDMGYMGHGIFGTWHDVHYLTWHITLMLRTPPQGHQDSLHIPAFLTSWLRSYIGFCWHRIFAYFTFCGGAPLFLFWCNTLELKKKNTHTHTHTHTHAHTHMHKHTHAEHVRYLHT